MTPTRAGGTAASEWVIGDLLMRGSPSAPISLATTASTSFDVVTAGESEFSLNVSMTGAADADLTVTVVTLQPDGVTAGPVVPPLQSTASKFAGSTVTFYGNYDVSGVDRIRVTIKNNNAGTQTANYSWKLT